MSWLLHSNWGKKIADLLSEMDFKSEISSKQIAKKLMGRRRWQHYQQLLMENVHLKDDDRQMEEKDWESSDKCNFCDESSNTSQQTVDNIVPESEEQPKTKNHSSESSYETEDSEEEVVGSRNNFNFRRSHQFHTSNIPESFYFSKNKLNSMSSVDSAVAASMAAVAAMNNLTNNLPKSFGNLRFPSNVSAADMLPQWYLPNNFKMENIAKRAEEPDTEVSDDQPLDLSAKTSSPLNSPRESPTEVPSPVFTSQSFTSHSTSPSKVSVYNSNRHIFKAKPRLSPMTGRRTYTEEELQAALRDIQSGKVGTRRAAVLYGIPRSTLRNKVYKLTMENERNKTTTQQSSTMDDRQTEGDVDVPSDDKEELEERENEEEEEEDGEKELSPVEEEMKDERNFMKPTFTVDDLIRLTKQTSAPIVESDSLRAFFEHSLAKQHEKDSPASAVPLPPPLYSIFPPGAAEIWGNLDAASIAPYLTHLMAATRDTFSVSSLLAHPNPYFNVRNQNSSNESPTDVSPAFSPKFAAPTLFPELLQKMLAETEEQRKRETLNAAAAAKTAGSGGGSGAVSFSSPPNADANNPSEELSGSSILRRLPLFKPSYKNGSTSESGFCNVSSDYNADNRISEGSEKSVTSSPPPINAPRSESSSPLPSNNKVLNLRDVITKAIGSRYHQQPPTTSDVHLSHISAANANASIDGLHRVSFPSLIGNSVIKSHSSSGGSSGVGGMSTEDRKICNQAKVPLPSSSAGSSNTGGGKGTRPKRGKYRNYDRDSLVEAVRAVQRGEMSVHRAGSYYGVPHSTLEYKVKERHLMRPRKREPKNQPEELKRREDGSVLRLSSGAGAGVVANEKASAQLHSPSSTAQQPKVSKSPFTPPSSLPTTPNGLKIPALFDAAAAAAAAAAAHPFAPATPFPFWPAPFHQLAMDYSRGSAFSANPEHLLASHFVQRIQEESAKTNQLAAAAAAASAGPNLAALSKNAREMAESLYDGSGINGSFLDGVIRSSLDNDQTFGDSVQKKNLLEQLYKHKYLNPNSKQSAAATTDESDDEGTKPSLNQILTQTLLSSAMSASAAAAAAAAAATSKDRSSSFAGDEAATLADDKNETTAVSSVARSASSTSADDDCDKVRADEMCVVGDTPQNQSLNLQVESHAVNMEVKSEKN